MISYEEMSLIKLIATVGVGMLSFACSLKLLMWFCEELGCKLIDYYYQKKEKFHESVAQRLSGEIT